MDGVNNQTHLIDDERDRVAMLLAYDKEYASPNHHLEAYSFDVGWKLCRDHYAPKLTEMGAVEIACKAAWERDYPDGGSIYKTYESTNPQDKELYRKEVLPIIKALAAAGVRFKPNSTERVRQ